MTWKKILLILISWRVLLVICAALGLNLLPFKDSFPYRETILEPYGNPLLYSWANFDGVHYLGIAERGYWAQFTQAFFPLFPLAIRGITLVVPNTLVAGLLLSHLSFGLALYYVYKLIRLDYKKQTAWRVVWLILLFPTAFYWGALYSESLFFLLIVTSLYAMRKGKEKEAIVLAALASATRIVGIFLIPALFYEKLVVHKKELDLKTLIRHAYLVLPAVGLLSYMWYLHREYNDVFYFLNAQPAFGAGRSNDQLILLYQVAYRYLKMFLTIDLKSGLFYTVSQEFVLSLGSLALLIIGYFKKVRTSYLIFSSGAFLLPTLTGTFSSMPRYVMILFPIYIVLAMIKSHKVFNLLLGISSLFLIINTILFTRGYWVA